MEADWMAQRSMLRHLITLHPTWTNVEVARCLHRSESWVKKWRKRVRETAPDDRQVLLGHARARHTPPAFHLAGSRPTYSGTTRPPPRASATGARAQSAALLLVSAHGRVAARDPYAPLDQNDLEDPQEQRSDPGGSSSQTQAIGTA